MGTTGEGDGDQIKTDVNYGFGLGEGGRTALGGRYIENTNNASMGAASPVSFDAGRLGFGQSSGNLDLVRPLDVGAVERATLVLGAEINIPDAHDRLPGGQRPGPRRRGARGHQEHPLQPRVAAPLRGFSATDQDRPLGALRPRQSQP